MKVAIIGYGKMGHEIEQILLERDIKPFLIIDMENSDDLNSEKLAEADVAIEFTTPGTAYDNIKRCIDAGVPVVAGTTGWLERYDEIVEYCKEKNGAFFYASNYSIGVNLMFYINEKLASLMNDFPQYDVTINEVHHTQKKDAPSGTAITLAEGILEGCKHKKSWHLGTTNNPQKLEVTAQRRSIVPGTHTVVWDSEMDKITIEHEAKSRRGFALGAVTAAEFMVGKRGFYSMKDLLKI